MIIIANYQQPNNQQPTTNNQQPTIQQSINIESQSSHAEVMHMPASVNSIAKIAAIFC